MCSVTCLEISFCRSPIVDASPTSIQWTYTRDWEYTVRFYLITPFTHLVDLSVPIDTAVWIDMEHSAGQLPAGLAQWLAWLQHIKTLKLLPNDFVEPPEALVATGFQAVKTYYMDLFAEGSTVERRDVKVVVVGMAGAGKTR